MKKKSKKIIMFLFLVLILIFIINFLVNQNKTVDNNELKSQNNYLTSGEIIKYVIIDRESDSYTIYYYGINLFNIKVKNSKYDFIDAIKENKIQIDELIDEMDLIAELNDGGTKIYQSNGNNKYFSKDYKIVKCNTVDGNKDIYIGNSEMEFQESFCDFDSTEAGVKLQIELLKLLNTSKIKVVSVIDGVTKKVITDKNKINDIIDIVSKFEEDTSKITTSEKNSYNLLINYETGKILSTISIWKNGSIGFNERKGYYLTKEYNIDTIKELIK